MKRCLFDLLVFVFILFSCLFTKFGTIQSINAQISENVFSTDVRIDSLKKGDLYVEIDNISFFKDDEYTGSFLKGYTLPGFWLQAKGVYYPLDILKLEAGVHFLSFWGADHYQNMAYMDIAEWKGDAYHKGVHVLPWLRAQVALSEHIDIVLGGLYGGANHNLIEPLYNPELNMIADPEMGLQFLYHSSLLDLDAWVNWESFIFRQDVHKEAFTVGLSTRFKWNNPESSFHFYTPFQVLAQHRGGEIDTIMTHLVQTLMNGTVGLGTVWNTGYKVFKSLNLEVDALGYYQQAGQLWPFENGYGLYARASANIYDFQVKAAYWKCHQFISMFGNPFYGAVSTVEKGMTFDDPSMIYWGVEYSRVLAKGFSLGVDLDFYNHLPTTLHNAGGEINKISSKMSFSAGIYLRINPSFLIKKFE